MRFLRSFVLALAAFGSVFATETEEVDDRVKELLDLQRRSSDAVIKMDSDKWEKYAAGKSRPYSLVVYLNSQTVQSGQLSTLLKEMRIEFGYTASSYAKETPKIGKEGRVFFAEIEFTEKTSSLFHRLGINSLPYTVHLPGSTVYKTEAKVKLDKDDRMTPKSHSLPWDASTFQQFVADRSHISVDVVKPSIFRTWWWPFMAVGILGGLVYAAIAITTSSFFHTHLEKIGIFGSLLVYWFATSGGLYNIIRNMPFSYPDHNTKKMVYFMQGSGQQLGAEGFLLGTLYMMFAVPLALMTFVVPRMKNHSQRDVTSSVLVLVMSMAVYFVYVNYKWKTGYHLNNYLFPSGQIFMD